MRWAAAAVAIIEPDGSGEAGAPVVVHAATAERTRTVAARVADLLLPGDLLCLRGDLGAGKTTFVQGLAAGLGVPGVVTSPTFTLVHEHLGGRLPLFHFDLYRLEAPSLLDELGFADYHRVGNGVVAVEWPERAGDALPAERLDVALGEAGEGRRITLTGRGRRWRGVAAELGRWSGNDPC